MLYIKSLGRRGSSFVVVCFFIVPPAREWTREHHTCFMKDDVLERDQWRCYLSKSLFSVRAITILPEWNGAEREKVFFFFLLDDMRKHDWSKESTGSVQCCWFVYPLYWFCLTVCVCHWLQLGNLKTEIAKVQFIFIFVSSLHSFRIFPELRSFQRDPLSILFDDFLEMAGVWLWGFITQVFHFWMQDRSHHIGNCIKKIKKGNRISLSFMLSDLYNSCR